MFRSSQASQNFHVCNLKFPFDPLHASCQLRYRRCHISGGTFRIVFSFLFHASRIIWRAAARVEGDGQASFQKTVKPGKVCEQALDWTLSTTGNYPEDRIVSGNWEPKFSLTRKLPSCKFVHRPAQARYDFETKLKACNVHKTTTWPHRFSFLAGEAFLFRGCVCKLRSHYNNCRSFI